MTKHLKRRTFLRGSLAGGVASIALPTLDAMLNLEQTAFADGSTRPRRWVSWFFGNGFILDRFEPIGVGPQWQLNDHMQALAGVQPYLNVVTGLTNRCADFIAHHEGMTIWSGHSFVDKGAGMGYFSNAGGPTIDARISEALYGQTPISAVHLGVSKAVSAADFGTTLHALSHRGYLQPNFAITSPSAAWQALFGSYSQPGDDRPLRESILDAVKGDVDTLAAQLGPADRIRLDAHLDSVAALEAKLASLTPVCELPPDPMFTNSEAVNAELLSLTNELMSELICYAFSCDLTRVATLMFVEGAAEPALTEAPGNSESWHQYSHTVETWGVGDAFDNGQYYVMDRFADLLNRMVATVELDGSNLLDNSIVLMSSDASDGASHSIRRHPMVIAGHGGGYLKHPGVHVQPAPLSPDYEYGTHPGPTSGNTSDVLLALLRAFDPGATWIGDEDEGGAGSGTPLGEILA